MPRGKRTRKKKHSSLVPPNLESPRKRKRKKWSNESLINAMEAVKKGSSIKRAAEEYVVPRTTLQIWTKLVMIGLDGFWSAYPSLLCKRVITLWQLEWMP